jgi:hypothetical protein
MPWWNVWTQLWCAVSEFTDALRGVTTKLRAHCDLPVTALSLSAAADELPVATDDQPAIADMSPTLRGYLAQAKRKPAVK